MNDNKLIAEFMGLPLVPCSIGTEHGVVTEGYKHPKVDVPVIPSGMQYKYSWDWLMPVVEKIMWDNDIEDNQCTNIEEALCDAKIDRVYDAVVEFIKTYNDGKQE